MPDANLRLLALTTSWPNAPDAVPGRFVGQWAEAMRDSGMDCTILSPPGHWCPKGIRRMTYHDPVGLLNGYGVPDAASHRPVRTLLAAAPTCASMALRAWQVGHRFDLLVAHWILPSGVTALAAGRRGCTAVHGYAHGGDIALLEAMPIALARPIATKIHRTMAGITFVSAHLARRFETIMDEPLGPHITVCPMGSELAPPDMDYGASLKARAGRRKIVATVGRLTAIKGLDQLVHALANRDDILWYAAGAGPQRHVLIEAAQQLNVSVEFLGSLPPSRVAALLGEAHVFVQPSRALGHRSEGTPVSALEALLSGVPSVFSATGGLTELATSSGASTFQSGDAGHLIHQIDAILNDSSTQRKMAEKHRQFARAYTWSVVGPKHIQIINDSVARFNCTVGIHA
ncbi:MAG: glycosyltransferase family 4 protein [Myxococcota bacterium]|nr:glycosyltransferase family 4 protein [Myxococcota bacterium]